MVVRRETFQPGAAGFGEILHATKKPRRPAPTRSRCPSFATNTTSRPDRLDHRAGARLPARPPAHEGRLLDRIARRLGRPEIARRQRATGKPVRHAGGEPPHHRAADAQSQHSLVPGVPGLHSSTTRSSRAKASRNSSRRDHRREGRRHARAQPAALRPCDVSHASRRARLRSRRRPRCHGRSGAAGLEHAVPRRLQGRRRPGATCRAAASAPCT